MSGGTSTYQHSRSKDASSSTFDDAKDKEDGFATDNFRGDTEVGLCNHEQVFWRVAESIGKVEKQIKEEGIGLDEDARTLIHDGCMFSQPANTPMDESEVSAIVQKLIANIYRLLQTIRPVDLVKLLGLLVPSQDAGDLMQDKDVVLLIGSTGSGKTTTIHYLAGTMFEEIVTSDGFDHFEPVQIVYPGIR